VISEERFTTRGDLSCLVDSGMPRIPGALKFSFEIAP
jgi:hypothetical protein